VQWRDVSFARDGWRTHIYPAVQGSTAAGQGAWVFIASCREESLMCPVDALRALKALACHGGRVVPEDFVSPAGGMDVWAWLRLRWPSVLRKALQGCGHF